MVSQCARISQPERSGGRPAGADQGICGLSHVAATAVPQYAGAGVLVAREHVVVNAGSSTPRLDALKALGYGESQK